MVRRAILVAGWLTAIASPAHAVIPRTSAGTAADTLTALPAAHLARPLRTHRELRVVPGTTAAWQRFMAAAGPGWQAAWDLATGIPGRIWGPGIPAPGSSASPAIAAQIAKRLLAEHLDLLAPGSAATDFEIVANTLDGDLRSVGFAQHAHGRAVVGGQISFRFKRDRLFVIGCEALPNVRVAEPRARASRAVVLGRAIAGLRAEVALPDAPVSTPGGEVVLPLVTDDAVLGYRIVTPIAADGGEHGRYLGYAEVTSGDVIAVVQTTSFATGTVLYRAVDRHPGPPRIDRPAPRAHVTLAGAAQTTAPDGTVSWGTGDVQVATSVVGDLVAVANRTGGPLAHALMGLAPDGRAVWDASAVPEDDAQVQVYLAINRAKEFVRTALDPGATALSEQLPANVNVAGSCNAFFDGVAVNFFRASKDCQNTGLIEDVVIHEFGHRLHHAEIIPGVGAFDRAMSEGAADFLAATMLDDPGMGRGFYYNDTPVRDLDPSNREATWPKDIGEIHQTGLIFGGAFWDLRKALIAALGRDQGLAQVHRLYLAALRRATDIPSSLIEVLAADDDDGDLGNGTPHECAIRDAFGRHGLRLASGSVTAEVRDVSARTATVHVALTGLSTRCATDQIDHATLDWGASGDLAAGSTPATPTGPGQLSAELPLAIHATVYYRVTLYFADGTTMTLADNRADPYYQIYQGPVVPLYCTDLEGADPFTQGWTTGTDDGSPSPWSWGTPVGSATDPATASSGNHVVGLAIGGDYPTSATSWARLPPIDVGQWSDVRLQYRRWLAVEDREYDQATILVDDQIAWANASDQMGNASANTHIDREWRFHDVGLSGKTRGHQLTVGWQLRSNATGQLGGWTIDDVCVVANPDSVCGDGVRSPTEECDDGSANADRPGACRTWCALPKCGDGIADDGEPCDDGTVGSTRCSSSCELLQPAPSGGGCMAADGRAGSLAIVGLVLASLRRRRRS